ncbi:MAG: c-type cytochrome [Gammaproteobacteria bacterium]
MRRLLLTLLLPSGVMAFEPSAEKQMELRGLLKHDCGACHGMTLKGGLGPALTPDALKEKDDDLLLETILNGRKGTAMPPWKDFIDQDEALWMIHNLLRRQ